MTRLSLRIVAVLLLAGLAGAQQLPDSPSQVTRGTTEEAQRDGAAKPGQQSAPEAPVKEGHERILGVVPTFGVTNEQNAAPLTPKEKLRLFLRDSYDPFEWVAVGLQAGISQATNSFPEFGQGAEGYGKRYGAALLDSLDSGFWSDFAYPVLLKQDPRYFRLGHGTTKHRVLYALTQEFSSKTDKGTRRFNWPSVLGAFTTGAISNAYYPSSDRGFGLTMSRSAISLGYGMAGGLGKEFGPDLTRKLLHKKPKDTASGQSSR